MLCRLTQCVTGGTSSTGMSLRGCTLAQAVVLPHHPVRMMQHSGTAARGLCYRASTPHFLDFGKHKGKRMEDVARDVKYVKWALSCKSPQGGHAAFVAYLQESGHPATVDPELDDEEINALDDFEDADNSHYEIIRPDGKILRLPNDGKLRCDVCGKACKDEQALNKHYRIHIRERNKRSGVGNGKKRNKKPRRNGNHALLPPPRGRR
mmetsp:Transcript_22409/g.23971  ORF Transcript_22409/g.23971 Transcript_22409/m.23971 type:complete len:208 (-) Transcript_22409:8-631(-)